MDWAVIVAIPLAGAAVLALVLWGMGTSTSVADESEAEPTLESAVPGVATGHHRSTETGGAA